MSICSQLSYIECNIEEEDKIAVLLKALPQDYKEIVTVLKEKEPIPSFESVVNSLHEEDKHKEESISIIPSFPKCLHCGRNNHKSSKCYKLVTCERCGMKRHPTQRCYSETKKDNGKEKGKANVNVATSSNDESICFVNHESYDDYSDVL